MAKKTARKKAATTSLGEDQRALMVPVDNDLWTEFSLYRSTRRANREFPWTVRDCMGIAIRDYLDKHNKA